MLYFLDFLVLVEKKMKLYFMDFLVLVKKMKEKMKEIKGVAGIDEPLTCLSFFISFLFYFFIFFNSTI